MRIKRDFVVLYYHSRSSGFCYRKTQELVEVAREEPTKLIQSDQVVDVLKHLGQAYHEGAGVGDGRRSKGVTNVRIQLGKMSRLVAKDTNNPRQMEGLL